MKSRMSLKHIVDIPSGSDIGRIYENIVFLELRRRVKDIYYIKAGQQEVDFYYIEAQKGYLINVCYDMTQPATREREIRGLSRAMEDLDIQEATIITSEQEEEINIDTKTIHIIPLWRIAKNS